MSGHIKEVLLAAGIDKNASEYVESVLIDQIGGTQIPTRETLTTTGKRPFIPDSAALLANPYRSLLGPYPPVPIISPPSQATPSPYQHFVPFFQFAPVLYSSPTSRSRRKSRDPNHKSPNGLRNLCDWHPTYRGSVPDIDPQIPDNILNKLSDINLDRTCDIAWDMLVSLKVESEGPMADGRTGSLSFWKVTITGGLGKRPSLIRNLKTKTSVYVCDNSSLPYCQMTFKYVGAMQVHATSTVLHRLE